MYAGGVATQWRLAVSMLTGDGRQTVTLCFTQDAASVLIFLESRNIKYIWGYY